MVLCITYLLCKLVQESRIVKAEFLRLRHKFIALIKYSEKHDYWGEEAMRHLNDDLAIIILFEIVIVSVLESITGWFAVF